LPTHNLLKWRPTSCESAARAARGEAVVLCHALGDWFRRRNPQLRTDAPGLSPSPPAPHLTSPPLPHQPPPSRALLPSPVPRPPSLGSSTTPQLAQTQAQQQSQQQGASNASNGSPDLFTQLTSDHDEQLGLLTQLEALAVTEAHLIQG